MSVLLAAAWLTPAMAQTRATDVHRAAATPTPLVRFVGQIILVSGPAGNPTGFALQTEDRMLDFMIAQRATFKALSAEAEVEGLQTDDYANVFARRVNGAWVAQRIVFDIVPIGAMSFQVTGTILRVTKDSKRFLLKVDSGPYSGLARWVAVLRQTRWALDGQLVSGPEPLLPGTAVQAMVRRTKTSWVAVAIDLRSSQSPPY